jgi:hypothetical protein
VARRGEHLSAERLAQTAVSVYAMARDYSPPGGELAIDRILYGYLEAEWGYVRRQHIVEVDGRRLRIDFWRGTRRPTAIELAVRKHGEGPSKLLAKANEPELRKLARLPRSQAHTRALLLMDLGDKAIDRRTLLRSYEATDSVVRGREIHLVYVRRAKAFVDSVG